MKKLEGHSNGVTSVCMPADGSLVVSGSEDSTVRVWDSTTGLMLMELKGHSGAVTSVCISPDGHHIVSGSMDHSVCMWESLPLFSLSTYGPDSPLYEALISPSALLYHILARNKDFAVELLQDSNNCGDLVLLSTESLDAFIKIAVSRHDVEVLCTLAEVLFMANLALLRSKVDCLVRLQTLADPSPRNLEILLGDPNVKTWMNIVLDSPGSTWLVLCMGPLHLLHLILYSVAAYEGQGQESMSASLSAVLVAMLCLNTSHILRGARAPNVHARLV